MDMEKFRGEQNIRSQYSYKINEARIKRSKLLAIPPSESEVL